MIWRGAPERFLYYGSLVRSNHWGRGGKSVVWDGSVLSHSGVHNDTFSNWEIVMPSLGMCHCDHPTREYAWKHEVIYLRQ